MQSQREQPFFKPLNESGHRFEFQHENAPKEIQMQASNRQEHTSDHQDFAVNEERLSTLHVKLHQEADKIRKWKTQTEFDIKQKDQKIGEASQTIESLRKSILDLQLHNESLSLKLQEEMSNREEIMQSISATRNLCSVLKEHCAQTDSKLVDCEAEKTEVQYQEIEHQKQFEDLSVKFKDLNVAWNVDCTRLMDQLTSMAEEKTNVEAELKLQTGKAEKELQDLMAKCDEKDIAIRDIRAEVERNNEIIHSVEITIDDLKKKMKVSEEEHRNTQNLYDVLSIEFRSVQQSKASVEEQLKGTEAELQETMGRNSSLQAEMQSSTQQHSHEIFLVQKELEENKLDLAQHKSRLKNMDSGLEKVHTALEEVKSSKDMLIMEKAELERQLQEIGKQNAELLAQHEQNCQTMTAMNSTNCDLQSQLSSSQQESTVLAGQLNELKSNLTLVQSEKLQLGERIQAFESDIFTKKAGMTDLEAALKDRCEQIASLTQQLVNADETFKNEHNCHETTKAELQTTTKDLTKSQRELGAKLKEIEKFKKELNNLTVKNKSMSESLEENVSSQEKLREEIEMLQSELQQQKETNESLLDERQECEQSMQGKYESKMKAASDLDSKNKTLKADITAKNKHIKELEKEMKSLKSRVTCGQRSLDGKVEDVERLQVSLHEERSQIEELGTRVQGLEEEVSREKESAETAIKEAAEMKKLADNYVKDKEEILKQCESQRNEMSFIMQDYKRDGDKICQQREKEIDALKEELKRIKKSFEKETDKQVQKLQTEVERLRKTVSESGFQMENLQKNCGEKENKLVLLEKENSKKNVELKGLQQQLEKLFIKNTTTTLVQTSPFPDKQYKPQSKIPTPTKLPPSTPKVVQSYSTILQHTPSHVKHVSEVRTPSDLKTPQRSILKSVITSSASKRRKVVFASKGDSQAAAESDDSSSDDMMEVQDIYNRATSCTTPLLLKPSPKPRIKERKKENIAPSSHHNQTAPPLHRTPRGPAVDLSKRKQDKKKHDDKETSSRNVYSFNGIDQSMLTEEKTKSKPEKSAGVRKTANKTCGKFFKNRQNKIKEKEDTSWFESDDVFGFACED